MILPGRGFTGGCKEQRVRARGTAWGSVPWLWVVMRRDSPPAEPVNWLGVSQTRSHATSLRCHAGEAAPPEKIPSRLRLWWRINSTGGLALLKEGANCRSASPRPSSLRRSRRIGWWMGCVITWSAAPVWLGWRQRPSGVTLDLRLRAYLSFRGHDLCD